VEQAPETLDIEQAIGILRRRLLLIALCVVVVAGAAYAYSKHEPKKYTASAAVSFSTNALSQEIAGLAPGNTSSGALAAQQANNIELLRLGDMAAKTASLLGHGLTEAKVAGKTSISGQGESGVVDVSATSTNPVFAADIANVYVQQFVKEQQAANRKYLKSALAFVHKQLASLTRQQRIGPDAVDLQNRAQTLGLISELDYGNVQVAQEAVPPTSPSSPKTSRNAALGILLGLLIGLGLALVLERLDRRLKSPEELETIYRLPLLGAVPKSTALAPRARRRNAGAQAVMPPAETEAFNLIRAHLRFFNIKRDLRTLVIASAAPGDGKTTIACGLAEAAARLGARVLVLETDLRHPALATHLGVEPGPGLADVLIGATQVHEATQVVTLEGSPSETHNGRTLDVLAAGAVLPPNPAELLEHHAMTDVLRYARSTYDLVVVDTPPLTAVSDAFPLLTNVDGVVIVGWIGRSRRDSALQLQHVLGSSGASLLGVIANGSKSGGSSSYTAPGSGGISPGTVSTNGAGPSERVPAANV
jgi:capsular exopolysaccharide synthesis family protein